MFKLVSILLKESRTVFDELADSRSKDLLLMKNPFPVIGILGLYLMFVLKWGPCYMQNRKPLQINRVVMAFDVIQIIVSLYLAVKVATLTFFGGNYSIFCEPVNYGTDQDSMTIVNLVHIYFLLKLFDLLDTVFFVLRKKNAQITFLHVYHHSGMAMLSWVATKYYPGGQTIFTGFANCIVHVVMYSYYLAVVVYPEYKKNFWWKKYITQMQIVQFFLITLHWISLLLHPGCGFPKFPVALMIPQNLFMFALFTDFYYKAYVKPFQSKTDSQRKRESDRVRFSELFQ